MGLLTGLCIGPLPALLRLLIQLTALQANYNSACLLRLNVCNDLAKAMKALDGKKVPTIRVGFWMLGQKLQAVRGIASIEDRELPKLSFENDLIRLTLVCLMLLSSHIRSSVCAKRFTLSGLLDLRKAFLRPPGQGVALNRMVHIWETSPAPNIPHQSQESLLTLWHLQRKCLSLSQGRT